MPDGYVFDNLLFNNFIYLSSAMVRRDVFYEVGKINDNYKQAEDLDLFLILHYNSFQLFVDCFFCDFERQNETYLL